MGKIKFIFILLILCFPAARGRMGQLWAAEAFHADFYADSKKVFGTKLRFPVAELRFSTKEAEQFNWGVNFSSKKICPVLPVTIKAGNLSCGGMLSHLNNPSLSAGSSPFSCGVMTPSLITASLPGYSSFSKPESVFFQIETGGASHNSGSPSSAINCWLTPGSPSPIVSSQIELAAFQKKLKLYLTTAGGLFSYTDNASSSWFSKEVYYAGGSHFCGIAQCAAELKCGAAGGATTLFAGLTGAVYETPFRDFPMNFRLDLKYKSTRTEIFTSAFYNPKEGLITSSQKSLPSCAQFKAGFTVKRLAGRRIATPLLIKSGVNAICQLNFYSDTEATVNAGTQISSSLTSVSISGSYKFTPENWTSLSFQLKNLWYLKLADTGFTINTSFSPDKSGQLNSKYKLALSLNRSGTVKLNGSSAFTVSYKQTELSSAKLNGALTARLVFPRITFTGKISADIDLYLE